MSEETKLTDFEELISSLKVEVKTKNKTISEGYLLTGIRNILKENKDLESQLEEYNTLVEDCLCHIGNTRVSSELSDRLRQLNDYKGERR